MIAGRFTDTNMNLHSFTLNECIVHTVAVCLHPLFVSFCSLEFGSLFLSRSVSLTLSLVHLGGRMGGEGEGVKCQTPALLEL